MCAAEAASSRAAAPVAAVEANTLFDGLGVAPALILAVSGGPDSTALMVLAAEWRAALRQGPALIAVTIDHGLRPESAREAEAVKQLAAALGLRHRTLRWAGAKPTSGLQAAARAVRYRLLAAAARSAKASHILTAHTLDDQAETILFRMARGSGLSGLGAMTRETVLINPCAHAGILLVRPLLGLPKARLIATLAARRITYADDPSNRDPRFTRARLRALMPGLAAEGLDAEGLARLARRLKRADAALELATDVAAAAVVRAPGSSHGPVVLDAARFGGLPAEVALRLLGRAIAMTGDEGPVELGKLETLHAALSDLLPVAASASARHLRRTLAGAVVTLAGEWLSIERAPPRASAKSRGRTRLTTRQNGRRKPIKGV